MSETGCARRVGRFYETDTGYWGDETQVHCPKKIEIDFWVVWYASNSIQSHLQISTEISCLLLS